MWGKRQQADHSHFVPFLELVALRDYLLLNIKYDYVAEGLRVAFIIKDFVMKILFNLDGGFSFSLLGC